MKQRNISLKNTIFSRMFFFNSILVIIIAAVIIPSLYFSFSRIYLKKIRENNVQLIREVQLSLDKDIFQNAVQIPSIHFSVLDKNNALTYPLSHDISSDPQEIYKTGQLLTEVYKPYKYVHSIDIYYQKSQILFDNGHVLYLQDIKESQSLPYWYHAYNDNQKKALWLMDDTVISYIRPIPFFKEDSQGIIAIHIDKNYINKSLATKTINGRSFFIMDAHGYIITKHGETMRIPEQGLVDILGTYNAITDPVAINQHKTMLTIIPSTINDWYYISMESISGFYQELRILTYYTIVISLLILCVSLLVAFLLTKKAHRPLNRVIANVKLISKTNFGAPLDESPNEYTLIDNTVNNLAVTIHDLNETLDSNKPIIRFNLIRALLTGKTQVDGISHEEAQLTRMALDYSHVFCFMLEIHMDDTISEHTRLNVHYNVISMLERDSQWHCYAIYHNNYITGIINHNQESNDYNHIINTLSHRLLSLLEMDYHLVIGKSLPLGTQSVHHTYTTVLDSHAYAFLYPKKNVILFSDLGILHRKNNGSSSKVLKRLEQHIRQVNLKDLNFLIQGIIMSLVDGNYTIHYAKNTLRDVVTIINNTLCDMGFDPFLIFGTDIRIDCQNIKDIALFTSWIEDRLLDMVQHISSKRQTYTPDLKEDISNYINENILNDITLDMIATAFHMRGDTFSKTFKTVIGENYSSYIKAKKMEVAKSLIEQRHMTISNIADTLGYSSSQYFIRLFKTKFGITPKKYQQQL